VLELGLWYLTPLYKQYVSYIVEVSFIGGGNQRTDLENTTDGYIRNVNQNIYIICQVSADEQTFPSDIRGQFAQR
jgi:hypothetical protein